MAPAVGHPPSAQVRSGPRSRSGTRRFSLVLLLAVAVSLLGPSAARAAGFVNWPAYLFGPGHSSYNRAATAISPVNVSGLQRAWTWTPPHAPDQPPPAIYASPTVYNGRVYVGTISGTFYEIDESTGTVIASRFLDRTTILPNCAPPGKGIVSTATVASDPATGRPTVYVAGASYLYALDADNVSTLRWKKPIGDPAFLGKYYGWGSPTVINGHVYIGVDPLAQFSSALGDCNGLTRGGLQVFRQTDGARLATYWTVPALPSAEEAQGGGIWDSPALTSGGEHVFVGTGNEDDDPSNGTTPVGDSVSVVKLNGSTLARVDKFTAPNAYGKDWDFGSSPTLFTASVGGVATKFVGSCNKSGIFYALLQNNLAAGTTGAGWSFRIGNAPTGEGEDHCQTSAINDFTTKRLYIGGNSTTIGGVHWSGSLRAFDQATGTVLWQRGIGCLVLGTPSLDGAGVIAVPTFGECNTSSITTGVLLYDRNGTFLRKLVPAGNVGVFGQPVFADNCLFVATIGGGLVSYGPSSATGAPTCGPPATTG